MSQPNSTFCSFFMSYCFEQVLIASVSASLLAQEIAKNTDFIDKNGISKLRKNLTASGAKKQDSQV